MTINTEPCDPWPVDVSCCNLPEGTSQETIDRWAQVASTYLWRASGMRYGPSCPVAVRPCRKACADSYGPWTTPYATWSNGSPFWPYKAADGLWRNWWGCGCTDDCSCTQLCEIRLEGPVYDVVSVQDGTVTLPTDAYRIDNGNLLVRTDGNCWPDCQDMAAAPGEEGTLTVTYRTGLPLDALALAAVSDLTCHYIKGCAGGCGCGAGQQRNVSRYARQGVTVDLVDPLLTAETGLTGIRSVDDWLRLVNPHRMSAPCRVYSPDLKRNRTTTWP